MKYRCVSQEPLSVNNGIAKTDYIVIHIKDDIKVVEEKMIEELAVRIDDSLKTAHASVLYRIELFKKQFVCDEFEDHGTGHRVITSHMSKNTKVPTMILPTTFPVLPFWGWHLTSSIKERFEKICETNPELKRVLEENDKPIKLLDLGCGFCQYWPIFALYGVREFVGVDLYDHRSSGTLTRTAAEILKKASEILMLMHRHSLPPAQLATAQEIKDLEEDCTKVNALLTAILGHSNGLIEHGSQDYYASTLGFLKKFLPEKVDYRVYQGDVRNIEFLLSDKEASSFDIIMSNFTCKSSAGSGASGIQADIFDDIANHYLKDSGLAVYVL